jgi:hypothetical protein
MCIAEFSGYGCDKVPVYLLNCSMQNYIHQLLADIAYAAENVSLPFTEKQTGIYEWVAEEEEEKMAPVRNLEEWTGISKEMLPSHEMLNDEQVHHLLKAVIEMLDAYNCLFVLQIQVPERIQYTAIRDNFNQHVKIKRWHPGFFNYCPPGTVHRKCALGKYCQCAFFTKLFSDFIDEALSPEEERKRELEIQVQHIKRRYSDDWMKYYPYHLDAGYDDANGNPYNYGFDGQGHEEDEAGDDWWQK